MVFECILLHLKPRRPRRCSSTSLQKPSRCMSTVLVSCSLGHLHHAKSPHLAADTAEGTPCQQW